MEQRSWKSEVDYLQLCNRVGYSCPKCSTWLPLEPTTARGASVQIDQCTSCGVAIVIDNSTSSAMTIIEAFADQADSAKRLLELVSSARTKPQTLSTEQSSAKKWWEYWK